MYKNPDMLEMILKMKLETGSFSIREANVPNCHHDLSLDHVISLRFTYGWPTFIITKITMCLFIFYASRQQTRRQMILNWKAVAMLQHILFFCSLLIEFSFVTVL